MPEAGPGDVPSGDCCSGIVLKIRIPYGIEKNMAMPENIWTHCGSLFWHRLKNPDSIWN
jgi:hypothetical protein